MYKVSILENTFFIAVSAVGLMYQYQLEWDAVKPEGYDLPHYALVPQLFQR